MLNLGDEQVTDGQPKMFVWPKASRAANIHISRDASDAHFAHSQFHI